MKDPLKNTEPLDVQLKKLGMSKYIGSSKGTREMTKREKEIYIKKTEGWWKAFKREGLPLGKKTILFRGKKYTKSGILL